VIEDVRLSSALDDGYVQLYASGDAAEGAFRCAECGYGVAVSAALPQCPMCAGRSWERAARRGAVA
jgi:rubrerythrin